MSGPGLLLLFTLIACTLANELIHVSNYADFAEKLKKAPKAVLLIICKDCDFCPSAQDQLTLKAQTETSITVFICNIGDLKNNPDKSFSTTKFKPDWLPYVAFIEGGELKSALNEKWANDNHKAINAGWRGLGGKG